MDDDQMTPRRTRRPVAVSVVDHAPMNRLSTALIVAAFLVCAASAIVGVFLVDRLSEQRKDDLRDALAAVEAETAHRIADLDAERAERTRLLCERTIVQQANDRAMWLVLIELFPTSSVAPIVREKLDALIPELRCADDGVPVRLDTGEPVTMSDSGTPGG